LCKNVDDVEKDEETTRKKFSTRSIKKRKEHQDFFAKILWKEDGDDEENMEVRWPSLSEE